MFFQFGEAAKHYKLVPGQREAALRCYKSADNHRSAMALMKSEGRYLEALAYHKAHTLQDVDSTDLREAALKHYEQNEDLSNIRQVLSYAPLKYQVAYLRSKKEMGEDLVQFYQSHQMTDELRKLYKEKSQFVEAARIAESIEEQIPLLIQAYKEYHLRQDKVVRGELLGLFTSAVKNLNVVSSMEIEAETLYYFSILSNNSDHLYKALHLFDIMEDNVGSLLAFKVLIKMDSANRNDAFKKIPGVNKKFLEVLKALFKIIDDMSNGKSDNHSISGVLQKLGYGKNNRDWMIADHSSLKYFHKIAGLPPSISIHRVSKNQAIKIASKILLSILKDVIAKDFHSLIYQQIDMNLVCQLTSKCENSTCRKLHQPPTVDNLQNGLDALFAILAVDGICNKAFSNLPGELANTSLWMKLSSTHMQRLYKFLQAYKPFYHITQDKVARIMSSIPQESKKPLDQIMWKEWQDNVNQSKADINLYVGLSYISYLISPESPLVDELRLIKSPSRNMFEMFHLYNDSLVLLYFKSNVKSFFYKTLQILRKRNINCETFCDIFEVPIFMLFACVSVTSSPNHPFSFCVPHSYIQQHKECEALYKGEGATKAIGRLPVSKIQWDKIVSFVGQVCGVLTNPEGIFKNLCTMINTQDSKPKSSHLSLEISRVLCLYLVVMSNLKGSLDVYGKDFFKLFSNNPLNLKKVTFLSVTFHDIGKVRNHEQAKELLMKLLKTLNDSIRICKWSREKQRLIIPGVISNEQATSAVRILKRREEEGEFTKEEDESKNDAVDDGEDEYNRAQDEDVEEDEDFSNPGISMQLEERNQQAKERGIIRRVYQQWKGFVVKKRATRAAALQKLKRYYAGLKIHYWFSKFYSRKKILKFSQNKVSLDDDGEDMFSEEIFRNQICKLCVVPNAKNKDHVVSKQHQDNLLIYHRHKNINKDVFDKIKDDYIMLDATDQKMEELIFAYNTEYRKLELVKRMPFPYSDLLQETFDNFVRRERDLGKFFFIITRVFHNYAVFL